MNGVDLHLGDCLEICGMMKKSKVELLICSKGFRYLRFEKWEMTRRGVTNIFYGLKVLRFKVFVCVI